MGDRLETREGFTSLSGDKWSLEYGLQDGRKRTLTEEPAALGLNPLFIG